MKKMFLYSLMTLLICFIIGCCILLHNMSFSESPGQEFSVAEICFDIGGAGYIGEFYLIDKHKIPPHIISTGCSSPGNVTWISENEFYINNRSGRHSFQISDDDLIEAEN